MLLGVMGRDRRPLADYGLLVGPRWRATFFGAAGLGALLVAAAFALGLASGALHFSLQSVSWSRLGKAALALMSSAPVAAVQQILFSGYLLTMLRQRDHRVTSVLACGLLFAVLGKLSDPAALLRPETQQVMLGLFSVGVLLATLRYWTGSIVYPAGLLAGVIGMRRVADKLRLLEATETPAASWLFPQNDLRCSPLIWVVMTAAAALLLWRLQRRGDKALEDSGAALAADFKATFPLSNTISLAPLDVWLGRLWEARFQVGWKYVPRLIAILVMSSANTLLTLPERLLMPLLLRRRRIQQPVFIVGVHRSGTTHLHNLLSLDPQFTAPTTHHIMNPAGCVFTGWMVSPVLGMFLPYERPMDSVRFSLFSPQEDEFGVCGLSRYSPYWGMSLPHHWRAMIAISFPTSCRLASDPRGESATIGS